MSDASTPAEPKSAELYSIARQYTPGGVHSNSRFRQPHPRYFSRAEGPYIFDVDGNRYVDCIMGNGAVILGHGHPAVTEAVAKAMASGLSAGVETELAVTAARKVAAMMPSSVQVRFTNTGTEASMHCLRIARTVTGRPKVAKVEGAYNGWSDALFISTWPDLTRAGERHRPNALPGTQGLAPGALENTIVLPFNDIEATAAILAEHGEQLAAVILEPVMVDIGFVPATREYLEALRRMTTERGIMLIFDELLTGFRLARGGAQEYYGVTPDLSMLGKAISNGMPLAAVIGRHEILANIGPGGPVTFNGTFNAHQASLAAVNATMDILADGRVLAEIDRAGAALAEAFADSCRRWGVNAQLKTGGGHFQIYFTADAVVDYRSAATTDRQAYDRFQAHLASEGVHFYQNPLLHHALSAAHGPEVVQHLAEVMDRALQKVAARAQNG